MSGLGTTGPTRVDPGAGRASEGVALAKPTIIDGMLKYDEKRLLVDTLLDVRVMAIDAHFYRGIRDRLWKDFGSGAFTILYEMGIGYGEQMGRIIRREGIAKLGVYRNFLQRGKFLGMGRFETPVVTMIVSGLKGEPVVRLRESFFAEAAGKTGRPECYVYAGMIAGAANVVLGKAFRCTEEKCESKGDEFCLFRLAEQLAAGENKESQPGSALGTR